MMIRPERQTIVGKAQSSSDRCVPTVRPGDLGAIDVLDGSLKVQEAKGGAELTVVGEGTSSSRLTRIAVNIGVHRRSRR